MTLLWLAVKNLTSELRRTLLMSLGLAVAVAGVLLLFGFARHTYWSLAEIFARSGEGHLQIATSQWFDSAAPELHRTPMAELEAVQSEIEAALGDRLAGASIRRNLTGMVNFEGRSEVCLGAASVPAAEALLAPLAQPVAGVSLVDAPPEGILLGQPLAERLGVQPDEWVTLLVTTDQGLTNAADFQVVGLGRTGVDLLDRTLARLPLDSAMSILGAEDADVLVMALQETADTDEAMAEVRTVLHQHPELDVRAWYELAHYYIAVKALYDRIFGIFQVLMLSVAGLTLSHAVAAVVAQRRSEVALLRVIGLGRRQVRSLFLLEGALLGLLGCLLGVALANAVALITQLAGGIPMPPPPGFEDGYAAMFLLEAPGYATVLPLTIVVSMLASALPAGRAARGALSRALMGAALLLLLLPSSARASDRLARADALRALPADQLCVIDLEIEERGNTVGWQVWVKGERSLATTTTRSEGQAQTLLWDGEALWMRTAGMRRSMRIGPSHLLAGRVALADLLARPLSERWQILEDRGDTVLVEAKPGTSGAYRSAELDFEGDRLIAARYAGPSGKVVRQASWTWSEDSLEIIVEDAVAGGKPTLLRARAPRCSPGNLSVGPEDLGEFSGQSDSSESTEESE